MFPRRSTPKYTWIGKLSTTPPPHPKLNFAVSTIALGLSTPSCPLSPATQPKGARFGGWPWWPRRGHAVPTPNSQTHSSAPPLLLESGLSPAHAPTRRGPSRATPPGDKHPPFPPTYSQFSPAMPDSVASPSFPEKNSPRPQRATSEKRTRGRALLMTGRGWRGSRSEFSGRTARAQAASSRLVRADAHGLGGMKWRCGGH